MLQKQYNHSSPTWHSTLFFSLAFSLTPTIWAVVDKHLNTLRVTLGVLMTSHSGLKQITTHWQKANWDFTKMMKSGRKVHLFCDVRNQVGFMVLWPQQALSIATKIQSSCKKCDESWSIGNETCLIHFGFLQNSSDSYMQRNEDY